MYHAKDKAHEEAQCAGEGIIGLLGVVESDLTKALAEAMASEDSAQKAYEKLSKGMRLLK